MVPKISPTLRGGVGGTTDALAGSPGGAGRTKKIVAKDVIKVSKNFGVMLQCRYPSRHCSGSGTLDGSLVASQSVVIPSDEELSEAEDSTRAAKPAPSADEEKDFAAAETSNSPGDKDYEVVEEKAGNGVDAINYDAERHYAPTGRTRAKRGRPTASRVARKNRPFKKEASSAQGVSGACAHARDRAASGGVAAENKTQGKTRQGVSSADFFVAHERQSKKEAGSAHGVAGAAGARTQARMVPADRPPKRWRQPTALDLAWRPSATI